MKVENLEITQIKEVKEGISKAGKEWQKLEFVGTTQDRYNNLYCFEIFGEDKLNNFLKYNKLGSLVDVDFNVSTREHEGKHYTTLLAWKVFKANSKENETNNNKEQNTDDLPF